MATGTLTGQTIANTYKSLLKITGTTAGGETLHATNQIVIEDGDGNPFPLSAAQDALMITSTNRLEFGDTGTYIFQSADGVLDLVSDTEVEINGALIDINSSGAMTLDVADDSNITVAGSNKDLSIAVSGGSTQTLTISSAGTGANAIGLTASAGGITVGLGGGAGDDFIVDTTTLVVESDNNRVGIGTTAPGDILTIVDTTLPTLGIFYSDADGAGSDGDDLAKIEFGIYDSDAGRFGAGVRILGEAAGTIGGGADDFPMNLHIQILDDGTAESGFVTAIVVQQDGNVGIGTTGPSEMLEIKPASTGGAAVLINTNGAGSDSGLILAENGTSKWKILNSGSDDHLEVYDYGDSSVIVSLTSTNSSWTNDSDERIKKDIANISSTLDSINKLRPITYKKKYGTLGNTHAGLIAQEVKPHFPLVVSGEEDAFEETTPTDERPNQYKGAMGITYTSFVPYLIKAVQELTAKVEALENA